MILYFLSFAFLALFLFCTSVIVSITRSSNSKVKELYEEKVSRYKYSRLVLSRSEFYLFMVRLVRTATVLFLGLTILNLISGLEWWIQLRANHTIFAFSINVLSFIILSLFLVGLEQFVRGVVLSFPEKLLILASPILVKILQLLVPVIYILDLFVNKLLAAFGLENIPDRVRTVSMEQIPELVKQSTMAGEIEEDESELIRGVFAFSDTLVKEIMTPRTDIIYVDIEASLNDVVKLIMDEGFSRLLVIGEDLDDVKGLLIAKDLLQFIDDNGDCFKLSEILRQPLFVAEHMEISELLKEFRESAQQFAVIIDEHGGVDGIVTIEDIIEELVGEIFDEYDVPDDEIEVFSETNGELVIDGSASIDDLTEEYHLNLPEGEYDTIAGLIIHELDKIPDVGEEVSCSNVVLRVEQCSYNRITRVRLTKNKKVSNIK